MGTNASRTDWKKLNLDSEITGEPTPPADRELLMLAEFFVRSVATSPYANAGKLFDGATARDTDGNATIDEDNRERRIHQIFAPATRKARFFVYRFGTGQAAQADTEVSGSEGGLSLFSVAKSPATGTEFFGRWDRRTPGNASPSGPSGVDGSGGLTLSGTTEPTATGLESYVKIRELRTPSPEANSRYIVKRAYGFSLFVPTEGQSPNLEVL